MKKKLLFVVLIAVMLACNALAFPRSTPTPEIEFPSPIMVTPNSVRNPPATQSGYQSVSAIIARMAPGPFFLLGGTDNDEWLNADTVVSHLSDETYQVFGVNGRTSLTKGEHPVLEEPCQIYRVETDSYPLSGPAVGVTGSWDVTPRLVEEFPVDTLVYVDEVRNWLMDKGFAEPVVEISQILRVDIEGDGSDEVLISASHFVEPTGHDVEFGDYSLVLMRKVTGDFVETIPIVADYYYDVAMQFPLTYAMTFPADLNNDGVLEILIGVERWEGSGIIVFELDGSTAHPVFEALCGL